MSNIIVFFSPFKKHGATTSTIIALAHAALLEKDNRVALVQTKFNDSSLYRELISEQNISNGFQDTGLDSLLRDFKSRPLTEELVVQDAITVPNLNGKMNLFVGTGKASESVYEEGIVGTIGPILNAVAECHDVVMVDTQNNVTELNEKLFQVADRICVCLPQDRELVDVYVRSKIIPGRYRKKAVYFITNEDPASRFNAKYFERKYSHFKKNVGEIYHNTGFMDALNMSKVVQFFIDNVEASKLSANYAFIQNLNNQLKKLGITEGHSSCE